MTDMLNPKNLDRTLSRPTIQLGKRQDIRRWSNLALISLATVLSLTVWFSTNAIAPVLEVERGFTGSDIAWLTIAVQLGFVLGTLLIAFTNLADLMNTRTLFTISAVLAGVSNVALSFVPGGIFSALVLRILCGMFLGGVYPPGMKIVSGWFRSGRGIAIGTMVGALTVGSGSPHLLKSVFVSEWELTLYISSILAALAGAIVYFLVKDGPFDAPASRFNPRYFLSTIGSRSTRMVLFGYLGHQWELYAMWSSIPIFLSLVFGSKSVIGDSLELASLITFAVFIAVSAFIFRQPLMHMAHPASNELMMNYVGKNNQELISALSSSLWSASWFISAKIFEWLRLLEFRYFEIFLITAFLYAIGVILYSFLIREHEHNQKRSSMVLPIADELTID